MDSKTYLTNKAFCPLPWSGFILEPNGNIKNCIVSNDIIGDIKKDNIENIVKGEKNNHIKKCMLSEQKHTNCNACYRLEENKKSFEIVSSRIYYLKELKKVNSSLYNNNENFMLSQVDARWSNTCNFACVYCDQDYSSKWEKELNLKIKKPNKEQKNKIKNYIFENVENLLNVYLAGGEPLLMKENEEFLKLLLDKNPNVNIRVNTNLSKTQTNVFDLLLKFKNVHWTISVESYESEFEYIRYGGNWKDFLENLQIISNLDHKISFNMLWFILNYKSIFNTVDFLKKLGFHNNSFIIGPIFTPQFLNIKNLPIHVKNELSLLITEKLAEKTGYLLEDSYKNLLNYINEPQESNLKLFKEKITELDNRRGTNFNSTFPELSDILKKEGL